MAGSVVGTSMENAEAFYADFKSRMESELGRLLPDWSELDPEQARAWLLAFLSTNETALRMTDAVSLIPEARGGN